MLEVKDITKTYRSGEMETTALRGVSFNVERGDFLAIMGPSGSGKSTLMHILGCLDTPTSGHYFLEEKDVSELSDEELAETRKHKIGFVFQSFNLLPRTTVLRNVALPLIYSDIPEEEREKRVKEALKRAGLAEERFGHLSNQLSGGERQRVAIARALVNNPSLILADEPTGNLDSKTGRVVLETFQRLNEEQRRTVILITHERYIAEHAHRIINILDGAIVEDGFNHNQRLLNHKKP